MNLTPNERLVLAALADVWRDDFGFLGFAGIAARMKTGDLDRRQIRLACRSLKRRGLAEYGKGLYRDDGGMAGAGYCATKAGRDLIHEFKFDDMILGLKT